METLPQKLDIQKLNDTVVSVISADGLKGFEKAFLIADAAGKLQEYLTPQYMKPIMALQGNKLGFKTDKDQGGGYGMEVVKNCLIEAVLTGVQPFGNQFNIIAGNCYITKEGFGYLLSNFPGLVFEIIPTLPRINADKTSAAIVMEIEWTLGGETKTRKIDFAIKMNSFMGADAVIGKATRKARAWLYNTIKGTEIGDGDVTDVDHKVVESKNGVHIQEPIKIEELQKLYDEKLAAMTKAQMDNAKRIIANQETASYKKLHSELTAIVNE